MMVTASSADLGRTRRGQRGTARAAAGARALECAPLHYVPRGRWCARLLTESSGARTSVNTSPHRVMCACAVAVRVDRWRAKCGLRPARGHGAHGPDLNEIESTPGYFGGAGEGWETGLRDQIEGERVHP